MTSQATRPMFPSPAPPSRRAGRPPPPAPGGRPRTNHAGWLNRSTCYSLAEGFAMFLPTLASLDIDADAPEGYGTTEYSTLADLEDNGTFPWTTVRRSTG